jgi:hypothetical protein
VTILFSISAIFDEQIYIQRMLQGLLLATFTDNNFPFEEFSKPQ